MDEIGTTMGLEEATVNASYVLRYASVSPSAKYLAAADTWVTALKLAL